MAISTWRSAFPFAADDEDDRPLRRDATSIAAGMVVGGGMGALAGIVARPAALLLALAGVLVGGVVGGWIGSRLSTDEWDPSSSRRSYVGANSPDDDFADD
jgi:hypothetical protein